MLTTTGSVQILLSTYNGAKYIEEQINSIIQQTYSDWKLYIRDDGSVDNTVNKIYTLQKKDNRIKFVADSKGNVGAPQSFGLLIESINEANYIMFADQDDVWKKDKIELTLTEMLKAEKQSSCSQPILIYTNFIYVNEQLQPIRSKKNFTPLRLKDLSFNNLLAQNPAYGCTMMLNQSLKKIITHIPAAAENHDYWIALTASAFGKIIYLPLATILYRQHQQNISGQHDNSNFIKRLGRIVTGKNLKDVENKIKLATAFKTFFKERLSTQQVLAIDDFILLSKTKSVSLFIKNWKNGLKRQTLKQTLLFYLSILFLKTSSIKIENRH